MQRKPTDYLLLICRILVGLLFIFSGLIKANDPLGFGYKLEEYFEVFHLLFLNPLATQMAVAICAFEIFLGALLLLGISGKRVALGLLLMIVFFTFLTFYSAYFNVVRTCGCFGDAIPLTPWQSFSKDLVLLLLILVIYLKRESIRPVIHSAKVRNLVSAAVFLLALGFGFYTVNFLPVIDFLPYKIGSNIPDQMKTPPGAKPDEYQVTYLMRNKKTGQEKKVTDKEYLSTKIWEDQNWEIKGDPESVLLKKGFEPKIRDLKIADSQGTDYTAEIIGNPYYNMVIVAYDLHAANHNALTAMNALAINAVDKYNTRTVLLTSTSPSAVDSIKKKYQLIMEVFYVDPVPLKSMVRANPGLVLLKNGTIINKWHYHLLPSYDSLDKNYFSTDR